MPFFSQSPHQQESFKEEMGSFFSQTQRFLQARAALLLFESRDVFTFVIKSCFLLFLSLFFYMMAFCLGIGVLLLTLSPFFDHIIDGVPGIALLSGLLALLFLFTGCVFLYFAKKKPSKEFFTHTKESLKKDQQCQENSKNS